MDARDRHPATVVGGDASAESQHTPAAELHAGAVIDGRYAVRSRLGAGAMGTVYEAEQLTMGRLVAVKVLRTDIGGHVRAEERFRREMLAASRLEHPNTVRIHDFGQAETGELYLVMERLNGATLGQLREAAGDDGLPVARVLEIGRQITLALSAAHAAGLVHRDLKPENVFVCDGPGGKDLVKILDFGLIHFLEVEGARLTAEDAIVGTPAYLSPEQASSSDVVPGTDLYALGVVLFELLCGQLPFPGPSPLALINQHAISPAPSPRELAPERVSPRLDALIQALLAKRPAERPPSADAVGAELEACLAELSSTAAEPARRQRALRPWHVLGLMVLGGLIVWAALYLTGGEPLAPAPPTGPGEPAGGVEKPPVPDPQPPLPVVAPPVLADSSAWAQIAMRDGTHCGLLADGEVVCWLVRHPEATPPPDGRYRQIALSRHFGCGIDEQQHLQCWGRSANGSTRPPDGRFVAVATSLEAACALGVAGDVRCWGAGDLHQAGPFTALIDSHSATCGLREDGRAECFGRSGIDPPKHLRFARLATSHREGCGLLRDSGWLQCWGSSVGTPPPGEFISVAVGSAHACAARSDGRVSCFERGIKAGGGPVDGRFRQLWADGVDTCGIRVDGEVDCWGPTYSGATAPPRGRFTTVAAGAYHACALDDAGQISCWGWDRDRQCQAPPGAFAAITAGFDFTCALRAGDGGIACWGRTGHETPPSGAHVDIAASDLSVCALGRQGHAACWSTSERRKLWPLEGRVAQLAAGRSGSCGLTEAGAVVCNAYIERLGRPAAAGRTSLTVGGQHACAIRDDGGAECWGEDYSGETQAPSGRYRVVVAQGASTCAIDLEGQAVCWGWAPELDAGARASRFRQLALGNGFACGVRVDGTLYCWPPPPAIPRRSPGSPPVEGKAPGLAQ